MIPNVIVGGIDYGKTTTDESWNRRVDFWAVVGRMKISDLAGLEADLHAALLHLERLEKMLKDVMDEVEFQLDFDFPRSKM